ncbi:SDR family oxidoreductase [Lactobacillus sp.]|uniref:SDR family oxidoreductase n=1 Tax=Lactobacillus sp. TaxID=1591 RepID=UPI00198B36B7|nr:SDR family oxidoreductase [Lactobacillus sp.]MBD5429062.1 SDR family oxidoreductase [Lactobacillus sp.]MBD5430236.1 SDR family oxidoreductase [Lactobacillus sp.]
MKNLVVITGASSGFGKAMAKEFSKAGYPLLLIARRVELLEQMDLPNTICKKVDVRDKEAFQQAIDEATKQYGAADLLINNAGIMLLGNIETQNSQEWQDMLDINVMGTLNGMQAVINEMKKRQHGTIVNFSSLAGVKTFVNHAVYCATKFGIEGLSETAREELAPYNVRVMRIAPGAVNTELLSHTTDSKIKKNYNAWLEETGVGSITPEDIARTVRFAYEMPQSVNLREIQISDTRQDS